MVFLLRAGLAVGCLLMAIGLALALAEGRLLSHPVELGAIPSYIVDGRPSGYMAAGIGALILAPLARVVALAVEFARERDGKYALVATAVAGILVLGVAVGRV